jgi:hypothetical protein
MTILLFVCSLESKQLRIMKSKNQYLQLSAFVWNLESSIFNLISMMFSIENCAIMKQLESYLKLTFCRDLESSLCHQNHQEIVFVEIKFSNYQTMQEVLDWYKNYRNHFVNL